MNKITRMIPLLTTLAAVMLGLYALSWANRLWGQSVVKEPSAAPSNTPVLQGVVKDIDGKDFDLASLGGQAVMVVNVASRCGFTVQYEGLQKLYETYKDQGLVIVGFPANNFNGQEPGSDAEIKQFCSSKYSVAFPMMSKISVKGDDIHPLYKRLTQAPDAGEFAGDVQWNFTKFLIDRNGNVMARFPSGVKPADPALVAAVEKALAAK